MSWKPRFCKIFATFLVISLDLLPRMSLLFLSIIISLLANITEMQTIGCRGYISNDGWISVISPLNICLNKKQWKNVSSHKYICNDDQTKIQLLHYNDSNCIGNYSIENIDSDTIFDCDGPGLLLSIIAILWKNIKTGTIFIIMNIQNALC